MEATSNSDCGSAACTMTAVDNKRARLPMAQLGVMIVPFRDAVEGTNSRIRKQCGALHKYRHLYLIDHKTIVSWQLSFYGTTASAGGHPPAGCPSRSLTDSQTCVDIRPERGDTYVGCLPKTTTK